MAIVTADAIWGAWTAWGSCSKTCGFGTKTRSRVCNDPAEGCPPDGLTSETEDQICHEEDCPGKLVDILGNYV